MSFDNKAVGTRKSVLDRAALFDTPAATIDQANQPRSLQSLRL